MKLHPGVLCRDRITASIREFFRDVLSAWHRFWFEPVDALMLGIIRLLTGWMLFYNLLIWSLDLEAFFGDNGLQPLKTIREIYGSRFVFSFWLWIGDSYLWPVHLTCLVITAMFCLGLATRVTSVLSFLITISYSQRVPIANFGFDQILGMLCLYLSLGPSGAACSLDSLLGRWRLRRRGLPSVPEKSASARMAMRLIQLHLCAIYFWAGLSKLKGPSWWTGEAMWRVIANQEYQTTDLTWMAWVPWLPFLIAHLTILWEVFFITLIWNRKLRPIVLAMGVAMHVGIGAFLGMWTFGLIMAFAYLAFSDPDVWRRRLLMMSQWFHGSSPDHERVPEGELRIPVLKLEMPVAEESAAAASVSAGLNTDSPPAAAALDLCSVESRTICVVASNPDARSTLRRYFLDHDIPCRAVGELRLALDMMSRVPFRSILVNGTHFRVTDLITFVADAADLTELPVLVMLTSQQLVAVPELEKIKGAKWLELPASLKEIRQQLNDLHESAPEPLSTAVPEQDRERTS
jgi:hypothetical protein